MMTMIMTRGPDGRGEHLTDDARLALIHTRLAIIDPKARADQPMRDAQTGAVIIYNGEVYNYRALRADLVAAGVRLHSEGDTEVILRGYLHQGPAFFGKLRGMYALVIYEPAHRRLLMLRDPLGIKPLYLSERGPTISFASSPQAAAVGAPRELDPGAAVSLAILGAVVEPLTPYRSVAQVTPGVLHTATEADGQICVRRETVEPAFAWTGGQRDETLGELQSALADSVEAHLTSDVPVSIFQSAGLDSTMLTSLAKKGGHSPTLLTIGFSEFKGGAADEVPGAATVAARLGLRHRYAYIDQEQFAELSTAALADMKTPTADALNTYMAAWLCREQGIKVALSGVGADEMFAGYPSFHQLPRLAFVGRLMRIPGARAALSLGFQLASRVSPDRSGKLRHSAGYLSDWSRRYLLRRAYFAPEELGALLPPEIIAEGLPRFLAAFDALCRTSEPERLAGVRALEFTIYLRNVLLRDADWAGMAHGVEIRTPFVDIVLLRALCNARLECGYDKNDLGVLASRLGSHNLDGRRQKRGFVVPHNAWSAIGASRNADQISQGAAGTRAWNARVMKHWFPDWALASFRLQ